MTKDDNFSILYRIATCFTVFGTAMFFLAAGQVIVWAMDRTPPFVVIDHSAKAALQGETATVTARVRRALTRSCSLTYSRTFIDSKGSVYDLSEGVRLLTAQALVELDKRSPDQITFKVTVPKTAAPGPGSVFTAMEYTCNPIHQLYPIPVVMISKVDILGAKK